MATVYKVHEFAELSGVTVKTLHHYDRLGLLTPRRTDAGYRIYTGRDLERLEQIVALKFLGFSLRRIRTVLGEAAVELPDALRLQRQVLEEQQRRLAGAIGAITTAEAAVRPGHPVDPAVLKQLIEAIRSQEKFGVIRRYFGDEAWAKYEEEFAKMRSGLAPEWHLLRRDIAAAAELGEDPAGDNAQTLGARLVEMMKRDVGILGFVQDPEFLAACKRAATDRKNWPEGMAARLEKRFEQTNIRTMVPFILKLLAARRQER